MSCTFSGAIAQFSTPWSMLLGVIPIANGPKQDTTRRDEMKPVNDKQDVLKKIIYMKMSTSWCSFHPSQWLFQQHDFKYLRICPTFLQVAFRKDGSSHTLPGFPKANPPPKSWKPTPPKAAPDVLHTGAKTQRAKLRGWTDLVHFVSFHKNHFWNQKSWKTIQNHTDV